MHPSSPEHTKRVRDELKKAGATRWGLFKLESRRLPHIIHTGEPIGAVVYGRYKDGSGMLIATDRRIIFLDRKPGYTISDELTYDVVAGVSKNVSGFFASVILHTRLGDYGLKFVNLKAAAKFEHYIEQRTLERIDGNLVKPVNNKQTPKKHASPDSDTSEQAPIAESNNKSLFTENAIKFLKTNEVATFSTVNADNNADGAVVYYITDQFDNIYILTKSGTHKAHNIFRKHGVALTIFEVKSLRTLQIQGTAEIETEQSVKDQVFNQIVRARKYDGELRKPPVTQLTDGAYIIIRVTPTAARFHDFKTDKK